MKLSLFKAHFRTVRTFKHFSKHSSSDFRVGMSASRARPSKPSRAEPRFFGSHIYHGGTISWCEKFDSCKSSSSYSKRWLEHEKKNAKSIVAILWNCNYNERWPRRFAIHLQFFFSMLRLLKIILQWVFQNDF